MKVWKGFSTMDKIKRMKERDKQVRGQAKGYKKLLKLNDGGAARKAYLFGAESELASPIKEGVVE